MEEVNNLAIDNHEQNESTDSKVSLWLGCTTRFYFENIPDTIKSILDKMEIDYHVIDEDANKYSCCASTLWGLGLEKEAENNKAKLEPALKQDGNNVSRLVSPCPGCTKIFGEKYDLDQKPQHITKFLFDNLDRMKFKNDDPIQVSYHDSCHLARGLGVIEEPRVIMEKIPNLTLKELSNIGENALCCASGGGMRAYNKEMADSMSGLIVRDALSKGSTILITACPFCERSFNMGRDQIGADLEVKNLLTLIDDYLI